MEAVVTLKDVSPSDLDILRAALREAAESSSEAERNLPNDLKHFHDRQQAQFRVNGYRRLLAKLT